MLVLSLLVSYRENFLIKKKNVIFNQVPKWVTFKGATRGGDKGPKVPSLAKSKLRNKIKHRIVLIFFVLQWSEVEWFGQFMILKIDYDTVKLQKSHMTSFYDVIKIMPPKVRHQNDVTKIFHFQAPPLAKSWLRSWLCFYFSNFFRKIGLISSISGKNQVFVGKKEFQFEAPEPQAQGLWSLFKRVICAVAHCQPSKMAANMLLACYIIELW